jgi:hypothetical protein
VLGRKFCPRCGHWRHLCDFRPIAGGPDSYCQACRYILKREAYARRTAAQREAKREYDRIWYEVKRRRAGTPPRPFKRRRTVIDQREGIYFPVEPLLKALKDWDAGYKALARAAGVPERTIYRFRYGESVRVQIDVADKLAVALGIPSAVLWRDEW